MQSKTKPVAWSYSALTSYETCPRRFYLTRISKQVVEPESEAIKWGNTVHKALELYAKDGQPPPEDLKSYTKYVDKLFTYEGKQIVEYRMAIDKAFRPTDFFAKDVWCRGIVDIGVIGDETAYLLDWKTGKRKVDSQQLALMTAMAFAHFPWVEKVVSGFVWLKPKKFDKEVFTRDDISEIWNEFLPRVKRLEIAHAENKWEPKPSGLCKQWCPVGRKLCEFCGG